MIGFGPKFGISASSRAFFYMGLLVQHTLGVMDINMIV